MAIYINGLEANQPAGWPNSRRVLVSTPAGDFLGWELLEDIEGYTSAGQLWLDGDEESTAPAGDWEIRPYWATQRES